MESFGNKFKITIFGESHSPFLGIEIENVPKGIPLTESDFKNDIDRRKGGSLGTTSRTEDDIPEIIEGIENSLTTGEKLVIRFKNKNIRPSDYYKFKDTPRPGHSDFVSSIKYGDKYKTGGGIFSGRMTLPIVAAGVIAKKIISPISISAKLIKCGGVDIKEDSPLDNSKLKTIIEKTSQEGDSIGGIIECICDNVPIGLGDPFFDPLESQISHLIFAIPGIRGIEFGDGFRSSDLKGSEHNDCYIDSCGHTATNGCGGINGGISNGNPIIFRVAVKPTSSIAKSQRSFNMTNQTIEEISIEGRHDICFALRVPVIIESVAACVLCSNLITR